MAGGGERVGKQLREEKRKGMQQRGEDRKGSTEKVGKGKVKENGRVRKRKEKK